VVFEMFAALRRNLCSRVLTLHFVAAIALPTAAPFQAVTFREVISTTIQAKMESPRGPPQGDRRPADAMQLLVLRIQPLSAPVRLVPSPIDRCVTSACSPEARKAEACERRCIWRRLRGV
jgi:hypothetical protein